MSPHDSTLFSSSPEIDDEAFLIDVSSSLPSLIKINSFLSSPGCAGISLFLGTACNNNSNNNSQGNNNTVRHLSYEGYTPMAIKELASLCRQAKEKYKVDKILAVHLLGDCPLGETSVVVGCSSRHGREAIACTEYLIHELKSRVPIWKKEIHEHEDGTRKSVWQENVEWKDGQRLEGQRKRAEYGEDENDDEGGKAGDDILNDIHHSTKHAHVNFSTGKDSEEKSDESSNHDEMGKNPQSPSSTKPHVSFSLGINNQSQEKEEESKDHTDLECSSTSSHRSANNSRRTHRHMRNASEPPHLHASYSLSQNRYHKKMLEILEVDNGEKKEEEPKISPQQHTVLMKMLPIMNHAIPKPPFSQDSNKHVTSMDTAPQEPISFTSNMVSTNLLLKLKRMQLSIASKRQPQAVDIGRSFQQFSLVSVSPSLLADEDPEFCDTGRRFLDPFVTKRVDLIDRFPRTRSKSDIEADALAMFCFPNGLRIRLIPRCAEEGARRLGWLGKKGDSFQLQGFTDVTGSLTHGVAITIREELKGDDAARVRSVMTFHRSRRRAAGIITRWWRAQYSQDLVWGGSSVSVVSSIFYPPIPKHIQKIGSAAYDAMMDSAAEREICIIEKSYVFTGTPLKEQSLFFCALQNLIDMERQSKNGQGQKRQEVLSVLHSKLSLNQQQSRVSYPRSDSAHVNTSHQRYDMDPSIIGFGSINLPLPLPEISGQWGLANLLLKFKDSGLIILLELLLLERSVLVVGKTSGEVTACATALLELLDPYKWSSAFMPLLPMEMMDFVSSPVPFIAGMICEDKQQLRAISHHPSVKEAMLNGLSLVNLVTGKLSITREKATANVLRRSFQIIPELSMYQKRLAQYRRSPSSTLRSFEQFCRLGASPHESLTLCKIKGVVKKHLSEYTTGLNGKADAWKKFGQFNDSTGSFEFCPHKFIQPLKDHMIFRTQFQEMMAHTQLFVGYVEELQQAQEGRKELLSSPAAHFIAQWVGMHWHTIRSPFCVWRPKKKN